MEEVDCSPSHPQAAAHTCPSLTLHSRLPPDSASASRKPSGPLTGGWGLASASPVHRPDWVPGLKGRQTLRRGLPLSPPSPTGGQGPPQSCPPGSSATRSPAFPLMVRRGLSSCSFWFCHHSSGALSTPLARCVLASHLAPASQAVAASPSQAFLSSHLPPFFFKSSLEDTSY